MSYAAIHPDWEKPRTNMVDGYSLEMTAKEIDGLREAAPLIRPGTQIAVTFLPGEEMEQRVEAAVLVRELGFEPEGLIVEGEPAEAISAYARRVKADLVVVGHRKKSLMERWWSGQTGAYLVDHIGCSLLVARRAVSDEEFRNGLAEA